MSIRKVFSLSLSRTAALTVAAAALSGAIPLSASARGTGAILGHQALGTQSACFNEQYGGVTNTCNSRNVWVLPALLDAEGGRTFTVRARGMSGNGVSCQIWSISPNGPEAPDGAHVSSVGRTVRNDGTVEAFSMSLNAHGNGAYYAYCALDQGTVLLNMHY